MEGKITSFDKNNGIGYIFGENNIRYSFKLKEIINKKRKIKIGDFVDFAPNVTKATKEALKIKVYETYTRKTIIENFHVKKERPTGNIEKSFSIMTQKLNSKKAAQDSIVEIAKKLNCNSVYDFSLVEDAENSNLFQIKARCAIVTSSNACLNKKEEESSHSIVFSAVSKAELEYNRLTKSKKIIAKEVKIKKNTNFKIFLIFGLISLISTGIYFFLI